MFTFLGALIIGLTLGLLGSGGSILTVPMLVYVLGHDDKAAIAESLAIVGAIALVAAIPYARSHLVDWRSVLLFGPPGMAGTFLGAWLSHFVPGAVQLVLFGLVMLAAAWMMFRRARGGASGKTEEPSDAAVQHAHFWTIGLEGLAVGVLTGLVGVGGGFLIVPALAMLVRLPMRLAVGTSLAIIALNAFSGFFKYLDVLAAAGASIDWTTVGIFILLGAVGSFAGNLLGARMNQQLLRKVFAVFLIAMGLFVLWREAPGVVAEYRATTVPHRVSALDGDRLTCNSPQLPLLSPSGVHDSRETP
ncbi:MAG: sulfite exporter TauE/SafE family protein [Pirellulaceae bacterium]